MELRSAHAKIGLTGRKPKRTKLRTQLISTMEKILEPTSIVGCSISLMFCLGAVVVLSCFREKRKPLLIKQQLSLSLVVIDIVILGGFQGVKNKEACRTVTTILHYGVLSCFAWLFADQYYNFKSVVKNEPTCSFMRLCVLSWGFPLPFICIQIALGFLSGGRLGSKVYLCWSTDYIILTVAIPALLLMMSSFTMLTRTVKTLLTPSLLTSFSSQKELQGIKYTVKTSTVMILLSTIIWIFGFLLFWYPNNVNYQLVFALGHGLQGLFNFFFHCVFALEQNMYTTTNRDVEAGELTDYIEDRRRSTKMTNMSPELEQPVNVRKPVKKMSRIQLRREPEIPSMVEEETIKSVGSVVLNNTDITSPQELKETSQKDTRFSYHGNNNDTRSEKERGPLNLESVESIQEVTSLVEKSKSIADPKSEDVKPIAVDKSEASSSSVFLETIQTPDNQRKLPESETAKKPLRQEKPKVGKEDETEPFNVSKLILSRNEHQSSSAIDLGGRERNQSMRRRESANSTASHASPCSRRTSRTSGSGPFGMNELESLFNNPDLMRPERRRSSSTSNVTVKTTHSETRFHSDRIA